MKTRFILTLFLLLANSLAAQSPFGTEIDAMIRRGIDHTLMARFDRAMAVFDSVHVLRPRHPVGWFYRAATLQSKMMDYECSTWKDEFYAAIDSAEYWGRRLLDEDGDDAWTEFYLGSALSYKGLFQAKIGKIVGGFSSAKTGLGHLKRSVELDSTLSDAYLGLGSYAYWSGKYYRYLRFLPWIHDEREKGMAMLQSAMDDSRFSYYVALNSLGWVEYDRKNYDEALILFRRGLNRYPGSRFFLWGMADTYFKIKDWAHCIQYYSELLESVQNAPVNNGYNEAICRIRLAHAHQELEMQEKAFKLADAVLTRDYEKSVKKRLKDGIETAREIRQAALEALGRIELRYE